MQATRITVLFTLLLWGPAGCFWVTTKHEGKELRRDVNRIDETLSEQKEGLDQQVTKAKQMLEETTKLLARNSADLGVEVSTLSQELQTLTGLVMETKRYAEQIRAAITQRDEQIAELEKRLAALESGKSREPERSADQLWSEGDSAMKSKSYDTALAAFRTLFVKFPTHSRADDAQYYYAEAMAAKGDLDQAIGHFQRVYDKYSDSPLVDDALFRAGEAAESLRRCSEARAYFALLRQKYPKSKLVRKAAAKDAELKKALRAKSKKCLS